MLRTDLTLTERSGRPAPTYSLAWPSHTRQSTRQCRSTLSPRSWKNLGMLRREFPDCAPPPSDHRYEDYIDGSFSCLGSALDSPAQPESDSDPIPICRDGPAGQVGGRFYSSL